MDVLTPVCCEEECPICLEKKKITVKWMLCNTCSNLICGQCEKDGDILYRRKCPFCNSNPEAFDRVNMLMNLVMLIGKEDFVAQYLVFLKIGDIYRDGASAPRNCITWYEKSAKYNFPEAFQRMGDYYSSQGLDDKSLENYLKAYKLDETNGDIKENIFAIYCNKKNYKEAKKYYDYLFRSASEEFGAYLYEIKDYTGACYVWRYMEVGDKTKIKLGTMYRNGFGVQKDTKTAFKYFMSAIGDLNKGAKSKIMDIFEGKLKY
jgi:tetratricopeptide (TPR) repeat protein